MLATWPRPQWTLLGLIVGAHAAMQLAIAVFNDYCDRKQDALGKPEKPLPGGLVTPREALVVGCAWLVVMIALLLQLPVLAGILSLVYLALGMAYNLGLKSTPLSGIVFALAMPLIPLYAFAGAGRSVPFLLWLVPIGFLLGVALNLANSLPDQEEDEASGARTLAVTLGLHRAFLVSNTLLFLGAALILLLDLTSTLSVQPLALLLTLSLTALLLLAIFLLTGAGKPRATRKTYFYLVTLTCIVLAGGWFIGVLL
jgi:4-hydroxybenzoate polyprenyltransferase